MKKKLLLTIMVLSLLMLTACDKKEEEKKEEHKMDYLILVNKDHEIPEYWDDVVELEDVKDIWGDDTKVEKEALMQFFKLKQDLETEEIFIELDSAYRSVKRQQEIWDEFEKEYGLEYTQKTVATPKLSEHHTGLAIDVCLRKNGKLIYENADMVKEKAIFAKVHAKLAEYGFILRYLEGKEDITGYSYEPWHLRYIRDTKLAKEIMDKGITLEEYLENK